MTDDAETPSLPRYRCHKEVEAAKIVRVASIPGYTAIRLHLEGPDGEVLEPVDVREEWVTKHGPGVGGYVVYADGYTSFSPASAFDEGYVLVDDSPYPVAGVAV